MQIIECQTDAQILLTLPVMRQLRPQVEEPAYLPAVRAIQAEAGRLIAALHNDQCRGCALFRQQTRLNGGAILYVDDLVTAAQYRSQGVGHALLQWIEAEARRLSIPICSLDSGLHREGAHRFYVREGYSIAAFHFRKPVI